MTTIDPNGAQAALFEKLGLNKKTTSERKTMKLLDSLIF